MSILFCTPCYGGFVQQPFMASLMRLQETLIRVGLPHDFLFTTNESLITRGRDTSAAQFLRTDYQYLMFIDSDIEFQADDVAKLWNLQPDIGVGCYTAKSLDAKLMAWKDYDLTPVTGDTPFEIDMAGTGFMMINRKVFETLMERHPGWKYTEGKVGECWGFFQDPIEVVNGESIHLSEDFHFCIRAREVGFKVLCDPMIKLKHYGLHGFGPN